MSRIPIFQMRKYKILTVLLLMAIFLTACSSATQKGETSDAPPEPTATTSPLPDEVLDTIWEWRELNVTDPQTKYTIKDPNLYTVFFNKEGFSDVEADCNFLEGNYHLVGNSLDFSVVHPRLQVCTPESASCTFLILLGQVDTYRTEGSKLVLPFGDGAGELVFYKEGAADAPPASGGEGPAIEGPVIEEPGVEEPGIDTSKKAVVCHKAAGKNPVTIEVSINSLQAHLNHGDSEGACP